MPGSWRTCAIFVSKDHNPAAPTWTSGVPDNQRKQLVSSWLACYPERLLSNSGETTTFPPEIYCKRSKTLFI